MGRYKETAQTGQVIPIVSPKSLTGKYIVIQLMSQSASLSLNEVKVGCAVVGEYLNEISFVML